MLVADFQPRLPNSLLLDRQQFSDAQLAKLLGNVAAQGLEVCAAVRIIDAHAPGLFVSDRPQTQSVQFWTNARPAQRTLPMKSASQLFDLLKQAGRSLLSRAPVPRIAPPPRSGAPGKRCAGRVFTPPSQFLHCAFTCEAGSRN